MKRIVFEIEDTGRFDVWRDQARKALRQEVSPDQLEWRLKGAASELFEADVTISSATTEKQSVSLRRSCLDLLKGVICHSDPGRFMLAYRIVWRAQNNPDIAEHTLDADIARARRMGHQVRRDYHKMTAFVRFREQPLGKEDTRRRFLSWFEPEHHVLERVAPFFVGRFTDMDWLILTPRGSIGWDGKSVAYRREACVKPVISDDLEALWHTYYASTFNPARIKTKAMRSEMPRKYWKNLPETDLIPSLLAGAEARVAEMAAREAAAAPRFHERLQQRFQMQRSSVSHFATGSFDELAAGIRACTRCSFHCAATQAVPGSGLEHADIMLVGEQPGDQEDLAGMPFVGPAGQMLDQSLAAAGLDRKNLYLTNAVKHFKFKTNGRRRIHQSPEYEEVMACNDWLQQEVALVKPRLIVSLGVTALKALEGQYARLAPIRDTIRSGPAVGKPARLATVHPSYLLRLPAGVQAEEERHRFVKALEKAKEWCTTHVAVKGNG